MKKIKINKLQEQCLIQSLMNETVTNEKVKIVYDYLNSHYLKCDMDSTNEFGEHVQKPLVVAKDSRQQPTEDVITIQDLFERLQYKFQNILTDRNERDKLLKDVINNWFNNKLSKYGSLMN